MIKLSVFKTIDYDILGDKSHVSISGGIATHSFEEIDKQNFESLNECMIYIFKVYGKPFYFDDRLELNLSDSERLSFYIDRVTVERVPNEEIKDDYNYNLEEY